MSVAEQKSTELVEKKAAPTPIAVSRAGGLQLQSLEDIWRFSQFVQAAKIAPKGMDTREQIVIAITAGMEVGLSPLQSVQSIAVINGRPCVWGDAPLGLCQASSAFDIGGFSETLIGTGDGMEATCTVRRFPNGQVVKRTFSVADAKKAGLWGKSGPWTQYPKRMLQLRARAFALRDTFADILKGIGIAEEVRDYEPPMAPVARTARFLSEITQPEAMQIEQEIVQDPEPAQEQAPEPQPDPVEQPKQHWKKPTDPETFFDTDGREPGAEG